MRRRYWILAVALVSLVGCRNTCCRKTSAPTCPPPAAVYLSPAPQPIPAAPEVIMPNNSPPPGVSTPPPGALLNPAPPAPNFPEPPRTATANLDTRKIASVPSEPDVRLDSPEFTEAKNRSTALKPMITPVSAVTASGIRDVVAGRLMTGGRPSLDDLDQLSQAGVRRIVVVGSVSDADRQFYTTRQMTVRVAEKVEPVGRTEPTYVLISDAKTRRDWWYRYFREVELATDEAARIRADRLAGDR